MPNLIKRLRIGSELRSVLIVDDEVEIAESLGRILKMFFKNCVVAKDGEEGVELFKMAQERKDPFTMVITDLELPKKGGLALIKEIRTLEPHVPILILSAHDDAEFMSEAIALEVQGYLLKPIAMPKLLESLEKVFSKASQFCPQCDEIDEVTGIPMLSKLEEYLQTHTTERTVLMRIRINHLANIYALMEKEEYADEFLKELYHIFKTLQSDEDAIFFRIAKDELILILQNTELLYAYNLAKDMALVAKYFQTSQDGIILNSTLSIGITQGKNNLLNNAKIALERSKQEGESSVYIFSLKDDVQIAAENKRLMAKMIYNAVENDQIIPYIHPAYNAHEERIEFYNSYMRIAMEGDVIKPATFLNIAKDAHQLSMLTRTMIKNSFALRYSLLPLDNILNIQLGVEDFYDDTLLAYILFWADRYQIDPLTIGFEFSSTLLSSYPKEDLSLIKELQNHGYKIILKDWNNEYSNLLALVDVKPDYVKLAQDVIKMKSQDLKVVSQMQKVIQILHIVGTKVVASFVESQEELQFAKEIGVDVIQGYKMGYPYRIQIDE